MQIYILESIIYPNNSIAEGYESVLIETKDDNYFAGLIKEENEEKIVLHCVGGLGRSGLVAASYLKYKGKKSYDINLEVAIRPKGAKETTVSKSNFKYMYWTMAQQLAHHTVNGCPVNAGDMMGSGTISGPTKDSYGSMLELTWRGQNPIKMNDGSERKFINDNDTVIMRAHCQNETIRIGFGECTGKILPAK